MRTNRILKHYWDIFLAHTCEFYKLEAGFVEKYEYELDWYSISKNRLISWDLEFLERYEDRFVWHELAWNEAILWNEEKIDRFNKRLDWYYLGRNRKLPITEDFIVKYYKKLFVIDDNPLLTKELIDKFKIRVIPKNTFDNQNIKEYSDDDFEMVFNKSKFYNNQKVIYEKVFEPIIKNSSLQNIFETKFNYRQRYYFFEPIQNDIYGLTPEFEVAGSNPFEDFKEDREPFPVPNKLTLVNGSLQEGRDRLYEIPRFSSFSYYTTLLVSENVRAVLEQYKLPNHLYHEVNLVPKKLKTNTKFYVLQLAFDTLNKDLVYENNSFDYSYTDFNNRGNGIVADQIRSYTDLVEEKDKLNKLHSPNGHSVTILPDSYKLNTDYDLYSYSVHGKIIINHYLKEVLEKNFPGQILFMSAQLLNIDIDQAKYDEKKNLSINTKLSSRLSFRESEEDKFFQEKMERLDRFDLPIEISENIQDKFTKKELELNVIFPEAFKNNYLNKRIKIRGYRLLPISKFYVQNGYADRYPETFKSVVTAENGVGDSVNLILEKNSDHELRNSLFEFFHETGEYGEI